MRDPATARPGAMPGSSRAAGLHNVDARARCHRRGRRGQHLWSRAMLDTEDIGVF
ncbi:IS110 family transposase, partial [Streptomyces lavendulae]